MFRGKNTKRQKQIYLLNNTFLCFVRVKSSLHTILFSNIVENRHLYNTDMKYNKNDTLISTKILFDESSCITRVYLSL